MFPVVIRIFGLLMRKVDAVTMISVIMVQQVRITVKVPCRDYYYKDWNGDGIIDDSDRHPMATFNLPVFNYGITLGAAWKGIDLSMNWQGSAGIQFL